MLEWEIYKGQMSRFDRGDALWEPAPLLPDFKCIQLGDVGYILRGCFHLLFSAGWSPDGREIGVDVPWTFKQLHIGPTFNTQPRSPGCLSTNTVRKISTRLRGSTNSSFEPNSSTSFRLTGGQGAALLTKHPTYREDVKLGRKFEEYTKEHYDSWVGFAREHGHPKDIKPVLVTGVDMTRDFAMMSYSNDDDDDLEARFTTSAPGAPSPWGAWDTPGVVHTNCGPQPLRPPPTTQTADPAPSGSSHIETVSDEYHQCVFVRYYTVRKRLGIPRVIKAAAGPHDLGPGGSHDGGSPLEMEYSSDSGSDIAQILFDDDGDNDNSSVTSIGSEPETVVHNTTPDEEDDFDTIADYIFQNSSADSALIHHRDIAQLREPGDSADLSTRLIEKQPLITVGRDGVGRIGYQEEPSTNLRSVGLLSITPPIPSHIHGEIEHGATDMMAAPEPRTPLRPEHGSPDHPASAYHEDVDMWAVHPTRSMTSAVQSYPTNENNPSGMLPTRYTTTHNSAGIFDYSLHTQTEYGSRVHPSPTGTFLIWPQPSHRSYTDMAVQTIQSDPMNEDDKGQELPQTHRRPTLRSPVLQEIYKPTRRCADFGGSDVIRFVVNGEEGIRLCDALEGNFAGLEGRDDRSLFGNDRLQITLRLRFVGCSPWQSKISTTDFTVRRRPITRTKLAAEVAKSMRKFIAREILNGHVGGRMCDWGNVSSENLFLNRIVRVSAASWQPEIFLERPPVPPQTASSSSQPLNLLA